MNRDALSALDDFIGSGLPNPVPPLPCAPIAGRTTSILRDTVAGAIVDLRGGGMPKWLSEDDTIWSFHPGIGWYLHDPELKAKGIFPKGQLRTIDLNVGYYRG